METSIKEKEYTRVKNSLEALGFTGYLGVDSVSLVRNILDNLIKATKSFKTIKLENERLQDEMRLQGDLVLPLRNENHKLLQDNNQLHKEIIDIKDKLEIKSTTSDKIVQKNIENLEEMKLLITQKNIKIKNLETQVENLKKKLNDVFEDIYMYNKEENAAQRGIPDSRKYLNYGNGYLPELCPLIKQEFNISGGEMKQINYGNNNYGDINPNEIIEAMQNENRQFNLGKDEWAKDLQQNNNEITKLRETVNNYENLLNEKNKEIEQYQRRLNLRDDEVKRLQNNAFLGDENLEEIKIRYNIDFYREQNEQLKRQNEFLNNENHRLNNLKIFHAKQGKEEEILKLKGEIEKLKYENNRLKQRVVYSGINTTNTRRKKNFTENSKMSFGTTEIKEDKDKKDNMKYQKIIRDLTGNNETIKGKLTVANKTINELKNQNQLLQNENDFLKKKVISVEKENENILKNYQNNDNNNSNNKLLEQINELKIKYDDLFQENKNLSEAIKKKDSEIINNLNIQQKESEEINKEMYLIKNQNNELLITKKSLEEEINMLRNKINQETNNIKNNFNNSNEMSANTLNQFNNMNFDSNKYDEVIKNYKDTQINLESQNKQKEQKIKILNEEKEKFESENKILELKNKNLNEQIKKLQNEVLTNTREDNINQQLKESNIELKNQIEKQNNDITNLEKTNLELKNIIIGIQNESNLKNLNKDEQAIKMNETISKLQKDNNKLIKNLELFKQENHLAAEKIKKLEELIGNQ
jgi:centrosomal protein CEP135